MENLLVTGGAGFIGSNLVRYLLEKSDFKGRVINVDKLTYAGNLKNLEGLESAFAERYVFVEADICSESAMLRVFREYSIDAVCHLAAESHVDRSIHGPQSFIDTNIVGTFRLLELARQQESFELFHHVSTDEVFGSLGATGYFSEQSPYQPNSPYSASKAASDHLVRAYHHTYGLPVTISNCSNNYGPYQFPEKLIPLMVLHALEGQDLPVYGDGQNIRDWLYVEDHCVAIWEIMKRGRRGETYNVGGNNERNNLQVVHALCDSLDRLSPAKSGASYRSQIRFVKDRPGHDRRYAIDAGKLKDELQWQAVQSFETGIVATVQWYLDHMDWVEEIKNGEYRSWMKKQYG